MQAEHTHLLQTVDGLWTFRPFDVSPSGRFAPGRIALWMFRLLMDVSPQTVNDSPQSVDFSPPFASCDFRSVLLR